MMHRFVAVISTAPGGAGFDRTCARFSARFPDWAVALDTDVARAWVFNTPPSRLSFRNETDSACVIGRDFSAQHASPPPADRGLRPADFLATRWGAYVAISVDKEEGRVTVLRDPTGRIDCWRLALDGADILFSHYDDVHWLQSRRCAINWAFVAYHLNNGWSQGEATGLHEISELLPGEDITYVHGRAVKTMAWRPDEIAADEIGSIDQAQIMLRASAEMAVSSWAQLYESIAIDLSGGLDSAIVLGLVRQFVPADRIVGINYVIPHIEGDEREYARDAAALHSIKLIEQTVSAGAIKATPTFSRRLMRPALRTLPLGYDELGSRLAKELAVDANITGTAGDHLFYDHLSVNAACDFRRRHGLGVRLLGTAYQLALLSRNTIWKALDVVARDMFTGPPPLRTLLQTVNPFLTDQACEEADYQLMTHPWIQVAVRTLPPAKLMQVLRIVELQCHYTRYGRADAAEEVHPLFSQPMLETSLRTPAYWFGAGGVQRGLARRAFGDLLPESIAVRRAKSSNTSHWTQVMARHLSQNRDLLLGGSLVARGLVDGVKLEAALTPLALATTKDFPHLVSVLTTEMWIQQAEADQASTMQEASVPA